MVTYKFRISPSKTPIGKVEYISELPGKLYNALFEERKKARRLKEDFHEDIKIRYQSQQNELLLLKNRFSGYKDAYLPLMENVADTVYRRYSNFFMRIKGMRNGKKIKAEFKSKDQQHSITYIQSGFEIMDNIHLFISSIRKIGTDNKQYIANPTCWSSFSYSG